MTVKLLVNKNNYLEYQVVYYILLCSALSSSSSISCNSRQQSGYMSDLMTRRTQSLGYHRRDSFDDNDDLQSASTKQHH